MKKFLSFFCCFFVLIATAGCNNTEKQSDTNPTTDAQTENICLPSAETDCLAVADKYAQAFQSLFLKYLQFETEELSIKVNKDPSDRITDIFFYYPVVDDEVKCYSDLKNIFVEFCTDEYAEKLLSSALYRDFNNALYKADSEKGTAAKSAFGCYINGFTLDGNKMTVDFINIGADNNSFDIDEEIYDRCPAHDMHFNMTLVWENNVWLISDCGGGYEDIIGYKYRPDITESMKQ